MKNELLLKKISLYKMEYTKITVKELRKIAKQLDMRGHTRMRKPELIAAITALKPSTYEEYNTWTVKTLRAVARQSHMKGYSRLRKAELIAKIMDQSVLDEAVKLIYENTKFGINEFAKWIEGFESVVPTNEVDQKVKALHAKVKSIFHQHARQKFKIEQTATAIKGFTTQHTINGAVGIDAATFLNIARPLVVDLLERNRQTKINLVLSCTMERVDMKSGEVASDDIPFRTVTEVVLDSTDVNEIYNKAKDKIMETMASFQMRGSNWRFRAVVKLDINTDKYKPIKGSSYIPLPAELASKKAIINLKNDDCECFKWSITRALNPTDDNPHRITRDLIKQSEKFNWSGIEVPVAADANIISKFERNNNISVNVFGYEKAVYPLYISKHKSDTRVDLLLISDGDKKHYCLIKNFNRLMVRRTENSCHSMHYCRRCLTGYTPIEGLARHTEYCSQQDAQRIVLPDSGTMLSFKHHFKSMRVPFVVYADFESFIKPIDTCQPDPQSSYTNKYQKHIPSSFCYYIKCFDDSVYSKEPVTFTAENEDDDVAQIFIDSLIKDIKQIYNQFKFKKPMIFGKTEQKCFSEATNCHICGRDLDEERVRYHCHLTGKFRGAAHNSCNLSYKVPKFFPVLLHNLSCYDSHLFVKKLRGENGEKINCIPCNEEKYISFSREVVVDKFVKEGKEIAVKRELRFIDSFRFMPSSLDALSRNLSKEQCKNLAKQFTGKRLDLLLRKGVYPYDYVDGVERLNETELPPKPAFYSKLNDSGISDGDYEHAKTVWNEFGFKTLRDYHNLYNVSDVLLLADVFENFRDVCTKNYRLDPAWYYTSPGLAWDAALKLTGVELELMSDYDMLLMIKKGIRGGVSTISNRYGKANNEYMGEEFDSSKPSTFITYLDANNLYGWAMSKPLPTHGFKWMSDDELNNWRTIPCILEVDLEYPHDLHDLHNDYPLAPESVKPVGSDVPKLIPNLNDKTKYVLHYENLKLYESLGLKLTKIHRGIRFEESAWLKTYIDLNTSLRTKATTDFEKDFFKLMNNSVFGKTCENIHNRVDVRLVCDEKQATTLVAKPNYGRRTIFDDNLIAIHMKKTELFYNKPLYLGACILDLSKTLIYEFHYNYIKAKYGDRAKLLFPDTDSLAYEIKTDDFYADIASDVRDRFDTSEYTSDHPSGIEKGVNKKKIGLFKKKGAGKKK